MKSKSSLAAILEVQEQRLLDSWLASQRRQGVLQSGRIAEGQLASQAGRFLAELRGALENGADDDVRAPAWAATREMLDIVGRDRALLGYGPVETANFVFSLKEPLFELLRRDIPDAPRLGDEMWTATQLIDGLGLYTIEAYQQGREQVICGSSRRCSNYRRR